jgi:hypothetical protein
MVEWGMSINRDRFPLGLRPSNEKIGTQKARVGMKIFFLHRTFFEK